MVYRISICSVIWVIFVDNVFVILFCNFELLVKFVFDFVELDIFKLFEKFGVDFVWFFDIFGNVCNSFCVIVVRYVSLFCKLVVVMFGDWLDGYKSSCCVCS